jgi:hypothetical protein
MLLSEVYSQNVMPWEIAKFIGTSLKNTEKIGEVRKDFLDFLQDKEKDGILFSDQVTAWEHYKEWQIQYSAVEEFDHLDITDEEILDESWDEELARILDSKVNSPEFLGNYSYGGKGLPSQQ